MTAQGPLDSSATASRLPGVPSDSEGVVFREPWEAQAFAIAVALHEHGVFSWSEWTAALAAEIQGPQERGDQDAGETYYHHWLTALERLLVAKQTITPEAIARYRQAWERAAHRTPHGTPIELAPQDFG